MARTTTTIKPGIQAAGGKRNFSRRAPSSVELHCEQIVAATGFRFPQNEQTFLTVALVVLENQTDKPFANWLIQDFLTVVSPNSSDNTSGNDSSPSSTDPAPLFLSPPIIATKAQPYTPLTHRELEDLRYARGLLENPGFAAKLSNLLGAPIEAGFKMLPKGWHTALNKTVRYSLERALDAALLTIGGPPKRASEFMHKMLVGASGGLGGVFGFATLAVELPISTTIMLRSIADIARSEGHDLTNVIVRLNCLEVFALGGAADKEKASDSSYWAVRAALGKSIEEAALHLSGKGVTQKTAPAVLRLISGIASRFGLVVSEEAAAKAVPVVGAAAGAVVNVLFMDHFQNMARGHFIVKRLEDKYGLGAVESAYLHIK